MNNIQLLILIFFGIVWIIIRLLRRKPRDTEQQQREGDVIFTESEMNLPWEQIPQNQYMLEEYEEDVEQAEENLSVESIEEKEEPVISQPPPSSSSAEKPEAINQDNTSIGRPQQLPKKPKQILGIPLDTQNVKFGIILSEVLNKPKSQRPKA